MIQSETIKAAENLILDIEPDETGLFLSKSVVVEVQHTIRQLIALVPGDGMVDDLSTLVRRLVRLTEKHIPNNEISKQAMDYLERNNLTGSTLRQDKVGE